MSRDLTRHSSKKSQRKVSDHSGSGVVRIISGRWRGRKLAVPSVEGLRPTPDRIRETVFNWLSSGINEAKCLDLFCGSGALGFEVASRGAKEVTLVDINQYVSEQIQANIKLLEAENFSFIQSEVTEFLQQQGQPMDLVFIDPPFEKGLAEKSIWLLENNNWLSSDAEIYVETESSLLQLSTPENWQLLKEKKAGQVRYRLYTRKSENRKV